MGTPVVKNLLTILIAIMIGNAARGQAVYTWNLPGGGNWTTAANWTPARTIPAANDILVFNGSGIKNVTAVPTQTVGRIVVSGSTQVTLSPSGAARTLTISNTGLALDVQAGTSLTLVGESGGGTRSLTMRFSGTGNTVSIAGSMNINTVGNDEGILNLNNSAATVTGLLTNNGGTIGAVLGNLGIGSGGTYQHGEDGGSIPLAAWNTNAECRITGFVSTVPAGLNQSFGNFTWNCPSQAATANLAGQLTTVNGTLDIVNTNLNRLSLSSTTGTNYILNIGGDLLVEEGSWLLITNGDNITATVNLAGDFIMTGTDPNSTYFDFHYASGGAVTLNKIIMNVAGDFTQNGGLFDLAYGSSDAAQFTELRLGGNFFLGANGVFQTGTSDNSISNGLLIFNKTGVQTISTQLITALSYTDFRVDNGSTVRLLSDIALSSSSTSGWAGHFTVNTGAVLDAGTFKISSATGAAAGVNNSFILSQGGRLISADPAGIQNNSSSGTISTSIASRTYHSDGDYEFKNAVTGIFTTAPLANTVRNLIINNSGGSVSLSQPLSVTGSLQLTNGILVSSMANLLTLNDNATATGGSYSPLRYVEGPLRKIGNDAFTFPVGKASVYAPASISAPGSVTAEYRAEYFRGTPPNRTNITAAGLTQISYCEYWDIEEVGPGSPVVNVSLSWSGLSACNAAAYVTSLSSLTVAHYDGTNWNTHGNSGGFSGNASQGNVTRNTVSAFSIFTLGSTSAAVNPLSVKFSEVSANASGSQNRVNWANASEAGIAAYAVEKSADGRQFTTLDQFSARSNNGGKEMYTATDNSPFSSTYYRIKATELGGTVTYSPVVKVNRSANTQDEVTVYPNPVLNKQLNLQLALQVKGLYQLNLYSSTGHLVYRQSVQYNGGAAVQVISLPANTAAGVYQLQVTNGSRQLSTAVLVK